MDEERIGFPSVFEKRAEHYLINLIILDDVREIMARNLLKDKETRKILIKRCKWKSLKHLEDKKIREKIRKIPTMPLTILGENTIEMSPEERSMIWSEVAGLTMSIKYLEEEGTEAM